VICFNLRGKHTQYIGTIQITWTTLSGKQVVLKIYVEAHNINKTEFAMEALKRAFEWDEKRFGLEYDLDIYII
jgi:aminopeptidase N